MEMVRYLVADFGTPWMRTDLQFREKKAAWGINLSTDLFDVVVAEVWIG